MKKLKFTPVYRGMWNMTPERYSQIQRARAYSKKVNKRREFWRDIRNQTIFGILLFAVYAGLFFLLLFM